MAGLYIHIPFCKQACYYCNFHFSTSLGQKAALLQALLKELKLQKDYLESEKLETIYLGGGTPSLLSKKELLQIFETIYQHYSVANHAEITLEANPDDLSKQKLKALKQSPINRLSIGIQSFFEEDLLFMNRAHNAQEAKDCIQNAQEMGFENLTIDLIYGAPTTSDTNWKINIQTAIEYQIPHISCYCLTVEPRTALAHFVKKGKVQALDEVQAARQFKMLMHQMKKADYEHYEISNFAKPNWHSKHNSSYWLGAKYLGIGPAAHSFNGTSRQWNIAHNIKYIKALQNKKLPFDKEILSKEQQYNEYVLIALRTKWGCHLSKIKSFGKNIETHFKKEIAAHQKAGLVKAEKDIFFLTEKGKLFADRITMALFVDE